MGKPGFRSAVRARAFDDAYGRAVAAWPAPTVADDVATDLGMTRVYSLGPPDAPPIVLVPGAGATAMTWLANVAALSEGHRVIAPDVPGQPGRSGVHPQLATGAEAVLGWLDQLLERLDVDDCCLCGHSYGAWLALYYALGSQPRCRSVALVDPTSCFVDPHPLYKVRAIPVFLAPGAQALESFIAWETRGRSLEPVSHAVHLAGAPYRGVGTEVPRRPNRQALGALDMPILVVAAERSRQHDVGALLAEARASGPNVSTVTIAGASHLTLPATDAEPLNEALLGFLARVAA